MIAAVEARFGQVNRLPHVIEWLSDKGSGYTAADTEALAREIGLEPRTTPVRSPQSDGMAEACVRTMKRDCVGVSPRPDVPRTVVALLPARFEHYNAVHPRRALGYTSPREFIADRAPTRSRPVIQGQQHRNEVTTEPDAPLATCPGGGRLLHLAPRQDADQTDHTLQPHQKLRGLSDAPSS